MRMEIPGPNGIEVRFDNESEANEFARRMKKRYGYMPRVFEMRNRFTGEHFFLVVKPHGLERI